MTKSDEGTRNFTTELLILTPAMSFTKGMAITSVDSALSQYNANLDWNANPDHAQAALEAVRYLIVNQPVTYSIAGRTVTKNLPQLEKEAAAISVLLGVGPRARGRSSFCGSRFADPATAVGGSRDYFLD